MEALSWEGSAVTWVNDSVITPKPIYSPESGDVTGGITCISSFFVPQENSK